MAEINESTKLVFRIFAFYVLFIHPALANGSENTPYGLQHNIDHEVVVVAHRDERAITDVASVVTSISQTDLRENIALTTEDIFRYTPGIAAENSGNRFGTEGFNVRGVGGNRVSIFLDGAPLSDQFSVGSFSNATRDFFDTGFIRSVEILHGPSSAMYGSSAIGGVIDVRTVSPGDITSIGTGGEILMGWRGSDNGTRLLALLANQKDQASWLISASYGEGEEIHSKGAPENIDNRDYRRNAILMKYENELNPESRLSTGIILQSGRTRSQQNSILGTGRFGSTTALEGDDQQTMQLVSIGYTLTPEQARARSLDTRLFFQRGEVEQDTLDERANATTPVSIQRSFRFRQRTSGLELNSTRDFTIATATHRLGLGLSYRHSRLSEIRDALQTTLSTGAQTNILLGEEFPLRDFPVSDTHEAGIYLEDTISVRTWTLIAALRADHYELRPEEDAVYAEDYPFAEPVSISETEVTPRLGLIWHATTKLSLYAQYTEGFRVPPFADANVGLEIPLFNIRALPNPDLKAERSQGKDVGIKFSAARSKASLSLFQTDYDDFIESRVRLGVDPASGRILFQSQNLRSTSIEGVEASASWEHDIGSYMLGFNASVFYARGENEDTGEPLNSVGPAQAIIGSRLDFPDSKMSAGAVLTLAQSWYKRDESAGTLFKPPGYGALDVFFSYQLMSSLRLRMRVENLGDKKYWRWSDVRGLEPGDPGLPFLARAGRNLQLSVELAL